MGKNLENELDDFLGNDQNSKDEKAKKVVLNKREGLIERVDKIFVTKDGKQLLRERY